MAGVRTCRIDCLLKSDSNCRAQTICTNQSPPSNRSIPPATTPEMTCRRPPSSLNIFRTNILPAPPLDLPVWPETGLGHGLILQGAVQAVEEFEADGRGRSTAG